MEGTKAREAGPRPGGASQDRAPRLRRDPSGPPQRSFLGRHPLGGSRVGIGAQLQLPVPAAPLCPARALGLGTQVQLRRSEQPFSLDAGWSVDTKSTILSPTRGSACPLFPWESWCDNTAFREEARPSTAPRTQPLWAVIFPHQQLRTGQRSLLLAFPSFLFCSGSVMSFAYMEGDLFPQSGDGSPQLQDEKEPRVWTRICVPWRSVLSASLPAEGV